MRTWVTEIHIVLPKNIKELSVIWKSSWTQYKLNVYSKHFRTVHFMVFWSVILLQLILKIPSSSIITFPPPPTISFHISNTWTLQLPLVKSCFMMSGTTELHNRFLMLSNFIKFLVNKKEKIKCLTILASVVLWACNFPPFFSLLEMKYRGLYKRKANRFFFCYNVLVVRRKNWRSWFGSCTISNNGILKEWVQIFQI